MTYIKKTAKGISTRVRNRRGSTERGAGFRYHQVDDRRFTLDMAIAHRSAIR